MGLSASQARLLSITARLTDNEYHSQQIANAKMRLAAKGTEAREEYQDALNSQILMYNGFDIQGNAITTALTPNVIYQYQPLKNQYALINNADQILVNTTDGRNFEETNTLGEFLDRYGVLDSVEKTTTKIVYEDVQVRNDAELDAYNARYDEWKRTVWDPWNEKQNTVEWTERVHTSEVYNKVLNASSCISIALSSKANCYMHVLADLLGQGVYQTSYNDPETGMPYEFEITEKCYDPEHNADEDGQSWCWHTNQHKVDQTLREQLKTQLVPEHEGSGYEYVDIKYGDKLYKDVATKCDEYCVPGMTVQQKIIDLLWKVHGDYRLGQSTGGPANAEHLAEFFHLIEFDLDEAQLIDHYYDEPEPTFDEEPPAEYITEIVPREVEETVYEIEVTDKEKAQWYTNLWYRMNGLQEPDRIQTKEGYEDNMDYYREYVLKSLSAEKDTFATSYKIIDANLASSTTWLEDVLSQGIVVMQRVNSHKTDTQNKFSWDEIIYTDAAELTPETDDNAIAKAEARYEEKMHEIETKDKRYQMEINKLDSEHNALQTQIDSIKSEVSKNVERSYKTFG